MSKSMSSQATAARCDQDSQLLPRDRSVRRLTILATGRNLLLSMMASAWLIASCQPAAPPPSPSATPATASQTDATESPAAPTQTPGRITPERPTATPTSVPETPSPTPDIVATVVAAGQPRVHGSYPSSDGQWTAQITIYDCVQVGEGDINAYEELSLTRASDGTRIIGDYQLLYCGGLGGFGLDGRFWSPNSRFFYYTTSREGVPDGCAGYWEPPLLSLDTSTWERVYLGRGPFSPDGTRLLAWQGEELILWDLDEGEIGRASPAVPEAVVGPIDWSPDGQAVAYLQVSNSCPPQGRSYVVRLDLPDLESFVLIESEQPTFTGLAWDSENVLRLSGEDGQEWSYDLATGELDSTCTHEWFLANSPANCPGEPPRYSFAVTQRFERGMMLWLEEPDFYGSQIYVFYEDARWPQFDPANDPWRGGWPENDPSIIPPPGFFQPERGFGVLWRERSYSGLSVRDRLGWAVEEENSLGEISLQCMFEDGRPTECYLIGPDDVIYRVSGPDNSWSTW